MFDIFTRLRRRRLHQHQASELAQQSGLAQSLVIPVVGQNYIVEAKMAEQFAARFFPALKEIVLVSDLPASSFGKLSEAKSRVVTLDVESSLPNEHRYKQLFKSRLIKLSAPLQAEYDRILMTDSDLVMLQDLSFPSVDNALFGSFRHGRMISKVKRAGGDYKLPELKATVRPYLKTHINGACLAATRATWGRLSNLWLNYYLSIWNTLPDNQPPTDQLPLCCALDHLDIITYDLGPWANWPVSKEIGGHPGRIPKEVIGAHGGFPIQEWQRYFIDPSVELTFMDSQQTRIMRYQVDAKFDQ